MTKDNNGCLPKEFKTSKLPYLILGGITASLIIPMLLMVIPTVQQALQEDKELAIELLDTDIPLEKRCLHMKIADVILDPNNPLASNTHKAISELKPQCNDLANPTNEVNP